MSNAQAMTEPLNYRQRRGHGGARKGAGRSSLVSDRDLIAIGARIRAKADELQIEAGKKLLWERLEEKHEEYFEVIAWLKDKPDRREIRAYGAMLILQKEMATVKADHRLGIRSDDYKRLEAECDNLRYLYPQGFDKAFDMVGRFDEVLMGKAMRHFHEIETNLHEIPRPQGPWRKRAREIVRAEWEQKYGIPLSNWQLDKATSEFRDVKKHLNMRLDKAPK